MRNGTYECVWDCKDGRGDLVPPGVYIVKVSVDTDVGRRERFATLTVAF